MSSYSDQRWRATLGYEAAADTTTLSLGQAATAGPTSN